MTNARVRQAVEREMERAGEARNAGNEGMVRVCARRAAGAAVGYWMQAHPLPGAGADTMSQLKALARNVDIPPGVRQAAERLCTRVTGSFDSPFRVDPLADARSIAGFCFQEE